MKKLITLVTLLTLVFGLSIAANAAVGTVVYGYKTDKKPNMEYIDESWGEPVIYVDKNSPNSELAKYWTHWNDTAEGEHEGTGPNGRTSVEPEDSDFWMYALYDSKYIYIAFKSPDEYPYGCVELHRGDGIYLWLQPLETMTDPHNGPIGIGSGLSEEAMATLSSNHHFWWNLAYNDYDVDRGGAAANVQEANIYFYDDMMHATIAIPRINLGVHNTDLHGFEFGICVARLSSWCELDEGQAGWLCWGEFMSEYTTKCNGVNTLVLVDPAQGELQIEVETFAPETDAPETDAPETEAPVVETFAPETDAPETDAPETDAPETEAPVVETDAPETDAPVVETDAPETEAPVVETDAPETEAPVAETDAPETDAPVVETEAPETEAPVVETDTPETEAPVVETDAPETEAPVVETDAPVAPAEPAKKGNTGLIIGIVAAVVVVGAVVGIVLGKKKK